MKGKIAEAILKLQTSTNTSPKSKFKYRSEINGKSFAAQLHYGDSGTPVVSLLEVNGYNPNYIKAKLRSEVNSVWNAALTYAGVGDIVYTRQGAVIGAIMTLPSNVYYYAKNKEPYNCSGEMLGSNFQAQCIGTTTAKCSPGSEIVQYTIFQLVS